MNNNIIDDDFDDDIPDWVRNECPCCGKEYDEIDYEYQICNICKYDNNKNNPSLLTNK